MSARHALEQAWARSDGLFARVEPHAWAVRGIPLRHPPIFYLGHLPAFAFNHLGRQAGLTPRCQAFCHLFERGIDPLDTDSAAAARAAWPDLGEVLRFRDSVRERLGAVADDPLLEPIVWMVVEHELMHHETLVYLFHALRSGVRVRDLPPPRCGPGREAGWRHLPGGAVTLGTDPDAVEFAWDNESPSTTLHVDAFSLHDLPVRNADFRAFVADGGYTRAELWHPADLAWVNSRPPHPEDWTADGDAVRWLGGEVPFADASGWPVRVSLAEAEAYARWAGARLPSEAELVSAARGAAPVRGGVDFQSWSPLPTGTDPQSAGPAGIEELRGNLWQWTSTPFGPFPGFRPTSGGYGGYRGYSSDFFDGVHHVVFGAAWPTHPRLLRTTFRNWYQRRYAYAFTTFRLAL